MMLLSKREPENIFAYILMKENKSNKETSVILLQNDLVMLDQFIE